MRKVLIALIVLKEKRGRMMLSKKQKKLNKKLRYEKSKAFFKEQEKERKKLLSDDWKKNIRERDLVCQVCKKGKGEVQLHPHHLLPKKYYPEYSLELMNGVLLCASHHEYGKNSAHLNAVYFSLWLECIRPEQYAWVVSVLRKEVDIAGLFKKEKEKTALEDLWHCTQDENWYIITDFKEENNSINGHCFCGKPVYTMHNNIVFCEECDEKRRKNLFEEDKK